MGTHKLTKDKTTPGTVRFKEDLPEGSNEVPLTMYLRKPYVQDLGNPETITVTIEKES